MLYKIFNSKIMWIVYFILPIVLFAVIANPNPIEAISRDPPLVIALIIFGIISFCIGKFFITDRLILQISNKELYRHKVQETKRKNAAFYDFLWNSILGNIILIIGFSWLVYDNWGNVFCIIFGFADLCAISSFISLSANKKD